MILPAPLRINSVQGVGAVTKTGQPTESASAITCPKFSPSVAETKAVAWEKTPLLTSGLKDSLRVTVTLEGSWVSCFVEYST